MSEPKLIPNLLGELVPDESEAVVERHVEQGELFENELTPELKLARKLAKQHREEGGKVLFDETP